MQPVAEVARSYREEDLDLLERLAPAVHAFPARPIALDGRRSAGVVICVVPDDDGSMCFLLTRRTKGLRRHSGQWALPGGRVDHGETVRQAALRELREELGVDLGPGDVLGVLDDFATRSGFVITPVVALARQHVDLVPDPNEVASAYRIPVRSLDHPEMPKLSRIPESDRPVISVPVMGDFVHAPTAAIIYQFFELAFRDNVVRVADYEQPVFAWR